MMNVSFLSNTPVFCGIEENEIAEMLLCLGAREKRYQKDEVIFHAGDSVHEFGLVLTGGVNIVVNFYWGSSNIFGHIDQGEIFGENCAAIPGKELVFDVVACEETRVLFLDMTKLLSVCQNGCASHNRLIYNIVRISAQKNLNFSSRMMHIAPKSIRGKLLSYFSEQAIRHGSARFKIPFNRQQLADYLGVDRSALSNELSKMQKDGLITFKKNEFTLKNKTAVFGRE